MDTVTMDDFLMFLAGMYAVLTIVQIANNKAPLAVINTVICLGCLYLALGR